MLRFRRDRLYVGIEPDRLSLVRLTRPFMESATPAVVDSTSFMFDDTAGEPPFVDALRHELRAPRWHNTDVCITLADRLVCYFIAERPSGARTVAEVRLAALLRFEDVFGGSAEEWKIQIDMPPFASRQLGCAVRKSMLSDLLAACADAGSPVVSLQPFAISEHNRWQSTVGRKNGWRVVAGTRSLWVAHKHANQWLSANQYAIQEDLAKALPMLLAQESLRAEAMAASSSAPEPVWLSGRIPGSAGLQRMASCTVKLLGSVDWPSQSAEWSIQNRIALSPVWPTCA